MRNNELIAKIVLGIILVFLIGFGIVVGLKSTNYRFKKKSIEMTEMGMDETETNEIKGIQYVDFSKQIVVDESTGILYIGKIHYSLGSLGNSSYNSTSYAYLCPYYSENGKKQKLVDGEIIELEN